MLGETIFVYKIEGSHSMESYWVLKDNFYELNKTRKQMTVLPSSGDKIDHIEFKVNGKSVIRIPEVTLLYYDDEEGNPVDIEMIKIPQDIKIPAI